MHRYRPDIDGLRAFAVGLVVLFHAFPEYLSNGYIGVDVFFVISGYLISGIILNGLEAGSFGFSDFYARRALRIFPALILVLVAAYFFAWRGMLGPEFSQFGKHIVGGTSFISNFILQKESGYFDVSADLKPLLHLWSLAIEEQFYILWPILLWVFHRKKSTLIFAVSIVILLSFFMNVVRVERHPASVFFMPHTRFWEIAVGALLALIERRHFLLPKTSNLLSWTGFGLLVIGVVTIPQGVKFPGYWALFPVIGTGMILFAGPEAFINRFLLSRSGCVEIGKLSYPLYLWHWPILVYQRLDQVGHPSLIQRSFCLLIALLLAWITYRWIERPLKRLSERHRWRVVSTLCIFMLTLFLVGWMTWKERIVPVSARHDFSKITEAFNDWSYPGSRLTSEVGVFGNTIYRQGSARHETLFVGDSNMEQYYPAVDELLSKNFLNDRSAVFITRGACLPIVGVQNEFSDVCSSLLSEALAYAQNSSVDRIVFAADWMSYFSDRAKIMDSGQSYSLSSSSGKQIAFRALATTFQSLKKNGKRVFVIHNIPVGQRFDPRNMILRSFWRSRFEVTASRFDRVEFEKSYRELRKGIETAASESGAEVLDPMDFLCSPESCDVMTQDGRPLYKDSDHIRPFFIRQNADFIRATLAP